MKPSTFDQVLASAVVEWTGDRTLPATLGHLVNLTVDVMETCDAAAVMLVEDGGVPRVVASDETLREVVGDHLSRQSAAVWTAHVSQTRVYSPDVACDPRWPSLGEALSGTLGIHSLYAMPLAAPHRQLGTLAVYAKGIDAFDAEDRETAHILALHATVVLAGAVEHDQLKTALDSRTVIGQATGIVMERFSLDATTAFGVLRRLSQTQNVKLRDVAAHVIETGQVG
jgi:transcriptional regulator with GAF, ATPase, and Fis domain